MTAVSTFGVIGGLKVVATLSDVDPPEKFVGAGEMIRKSAFDGVDQEFTTNLHQFSHVVIEKFATEFLLMKQSEKTPHMDTRRLVKESDLRWPSPIEYINLSNRYPTLHRVAPLVNLGFSRPLPDGGTCAAVIGSNMELQRFLRAEAMHNIEAIYCYVLVQNFQ